MKQPRLSEFEQIRIVDCYDQELQPSLIAKVLGRKVSTITSFYSRYCFNFGIPTKEKVFKGFVNNSMGRFIKQTIEKEPRIGLRGIEQILRYNSPFDDWTPSYHTIGRYLKRAGYIKKAKWIKPPISETNRLKRLKFAHRWLERTPEGFKDTLGCVIWTDETTVRSHPFTRKIKEWKHKDAESTIQEKHHSGKLSVCFWGCISKEGVGPLCVIEGTMDAKKYVEVLRDSLFPEVHILEEREIPVRVVQDNAPCHTANLVKEFLDDYDIEFVDWPPYSPDLNPIENLWALVKFRLYRDYPPAKDRETLIAYVFDIWDNIDGDLCKKYCDNYHKRLLEVIKKNGLQTKY